MNHVDDQDARAEKDERSIKHIVLRACPHCGPLPAMPELVRSDVSGRWQVFCGPCGSSSGSTRTPHEAARAWNSRAVGLPEIPTSSAAVTELAVILSNMLADLSPSDDRPRYGFASPERQAQAYGVAHLVTACMNERANRDAGIHLRIEALMGHDRDTRSTGDATIIQDPANDAAPATRKP